MARHDAATFTANSRSLGLLCALGVVIVTAGYAGVLGAGFMSLSSSADPIGDPYFPILETLILLLMPLLVGLAVAIHAWTSADRKSLSLLAVAFTIAQAVITTSVHFVILAIGRQPAFLALPQTPLFLSFTWPSVSYALDILAWDGFFALAVLCAAPVFAGSRLAVAIRLLYLLAGLFALGGFGGVVFGDMRLRNIGIIGYIGVFPVAVLLLAGLLYRTRPSPAGPGDRASRRPRPSIVDPKQQVTTGRYREAQCSPSAAAVAPLPAKPFT